jgi:bifunctional NMN adenylyltransferase/nudix hydrolase
MFKEFKQMSKKQYDLAVFIGRFQILHNEHVKIIKTALDIANNVVIFIGSTNVARTPKNPFTVNDRIEMIRSVFPYHKFPQLILRPAFDNPSNDLAWAGEIQKQVAGLVDADKKITLIGCNKDETSFYLKMFPQWNSYNVLLENNISATDLRRVWFGDCNNNDEVFGLHSPFFKDNVPKEVIDWCLYNFDINTFKWLKDEYNFYKKYDPSKYPITIVCADAVVTQSNHILLVTRKDAPGKGLLALPGGHVEQKERIIDAAVRELKEETEISDSRGKIPAGVLKSYIVDKKGRTFDNPNRDLRGRVITTAFHFSLPDHKELYKVKGTDDAADAKWYQIGALKSDDFHCDHYYIIKDVLGL